MTGCTVDLIIQIQIAIWRTTAVVSLFPFPGTHDQSSRNVYLSHSESIPRMTREAMLSSSTFRSLRDCLHCEHRSLGMFCNLDTDALAAFDSLGVHTALQAGTTIFAEEKPSIGVFVLCTGRVKLSCTSREGKTLILKIAAAGDVLGLGAVISGSRYEVTAETIEPTRLKSIPRSEFLAFLEKHGEASMHAAQTMSR